MNQFRGAPRPFEEPDGTVKEIRVHDVPVLLTSAREGAAGPGTALARLLSRLGAGAPGPGGVDGIPRLALVHDRFGRPVLVDARTGARSEIGISFSHDAGRCWAAAAVGHGIGIDAAAVGDFPAAYPYHRVFTAGELAMASALHGGHLPWAAAQLWATKEAAVKALGRGFHAFDYTEVEVIGRVPGGGDLLFAVSARGMILSARGRRERSSWIAVAVTGFRRSVGSS